MHKVKITGYRITKAGKVEKIQGYGMNASAKIQQRKSKRVRATRRAPG